MGDQMTWWGWVIAGAILFGAELSFVSAHFYLVFIGSAAIIVGLLTALLGPAAWVQWALFAALAVVSMLAFRSRLYQRYRGALPSVRTGPTGGVITLGAALAAGSTCQAEYGGTVWTVQNDTDAPIGPGTRVRITSVRDLTLLVRPEA
jgi:membrane protein implicated in regulation of membrane protease activity